jgi:hypothetical protein
LTGGRCGGGTGVDASVTDWERAVSATLAPQDAGAVVWLCRLGGSRLLSDRGPLPVRSGGKTEALLAHLGLAGLRGIARDVLPDAIWPNSEPALASHAQNGVLGGLRTLLGDALGGAEVVVSTPGQ